MLITNNYCWIQRLAGHNQYSQPVYGLSERVPCVIADLNTSMTKTSVRADSSASRGRAKELGADGLILTPIGIKVKEGDLIKAAGESFVVCGVSLRFDSFGRENHNEVLLKKWVSKQSLL